MYPLFGKFGTQPRLPRVDTRPAHVLYTRPPLYPYTVGVCRAQVAPCPTYTSHIRTHIRRADERPPPQGGRSASSVFSEIHFFVLEKENRRRDRRDYRGPSPQYRFEDAAVTQLRLPNRRASQQVAFECNALKYVATVSFFPDGRLAEIFLSNAKAGSHSDSAAKDSAVVASIASRNLGGRRTTTWSDSPVFLVRLMVLALQGHEAETAQPRVRYNALLCGAPLVGLTSLPFIPLVVMPPQIEYHWRTL